MCTIPKLTYLAGGHGPTGLGAEEAIAHEMAQVRLVGALGVQLALDEELEEDELREDHAEGAVSGVPQAQGRKEAVPEPLGLCVV